MTKENLDCICAEEINSKSKIKYCFATSMTQLQCPHYQQIHRKDYCFRDIPESKPEPETRHDSEGDFIVDNSGSLIYRRKNEQ